MRLNKLNWITSTVLLFFLINTLRVFLQVLLWEVSDFNATMSFEKKLNYSFFTGIIWDSPWYLTYLILFIIGIVVLKKKQRMSMLSVLGLILLLNLVVCYWSLNGFTQSFEANSINEWLLVQKREGWRTVLFTFCSLAFGFSFYKIT